MDLRDTVSIVTGGNGGLGQRICLALAEKGSQIAVVYATSKAGAEKFSDELRSSGFEAKAFQCDVSSPAQVQKLVTNVEDHFGGVDILINDAAYNKMIAFNDLDNLTHEEWTKILDINLTGPMLTTKAVAPSMMKRKRGRIVNISSIAGLTPSGSSIAYAVSKAGLNHLTRCMAVGLAPYILVNCIAPGHLEGTRATANLDPAFSKSAREGSLLKRSADKDDIANQVVIFCQTDSVTGQTLVIDAGRYFH